VAATQLQTARIGGMTFPQPYWQHRLFRWPLLPGSTRFGSSSRLGETDGEPGVALCQKLEQTGVLTPDVDATVYQLFDREDLKKVLTQFFYSDINKGKTPMIHFEVHGNQDGFGLRDGSFTPWSGLG